MCDPSGMKILGESARRSLRQAVSSHPGAALNARSTEDFCDTFGLARKCSALKTIVLVLSVLRRLTSYPRKVDTVQISFEQMPHLYSGVENEYILFAE